MQPKNQGRRPTKETSMRNPTRAFLLAFFLSSLSLLTIVGLNLTSSRLQIADQDDPAVSISHSRQGLTLRLLDDDFLVPESFLDHLESGAKQFLKAGRLLTPPRLQAVFSAGAYLLRSFPNQIVFQYGSLP